MEEVIKKLTHDGKYANEVCLLLMIDNEEDCLNRLLSLNITGKNLENLFYKCLKEHDIDYFTQTIYYLSSGFLNKRVIRENIESNNPVVFIDHLSTDFDNLENIYIGYTTRFMQQIKLRRGR